MLIADVIFPALAAPYFSIVFFPIAGFCALSIEVLVFRGYSAGVPLWRIAAGVVYANLVSWIAGAIIACFLPSGLVPKLVNAGKPEPVTIITTGPWWTTLALVGFPLACLLSIGIEYAALLPLRKRLFPIERLARCVILANVLGYLALLVLVVIDVKLFA
jgi:hypothetical protein